MSNKMTKEEIIAEIERAEIEEIKDMLKKVFIELVEEKQRGSEEVKHFSDEELRELIEIWYTSGASHTQSFTNWLKGVKYYE